MFFMQCNDMGVCNCDIFILKLFVCVYFTVKEKDIVVAVFNVKMKQH